MAINSLTGASATTTGTQSTSSAASQTVDEAQSRFMKLLVTQMQNQDPLNPMDNATLTTQIAQLNTVTGINQLNTSMQSLLSGFQAGQALQSASLIGRSVLVPGSSMALSQGQAPFALDLAKAATAVQLTVRDSAGQVVRVQQLGAQPVGQQELTWDGKTDAGTNAPDGRYSFAIEASGAGQKVAATTLAFGQVASVSLASGAVSLAIPALGNVALTDVRQVR